MDNYINLSRTYLELSTEGKNDDNEGFFDQLGISKPIGFPELLKNKRVIVLSEAGTGKTTELIEGAKRLRKEGKAAFFIRIENLKNNLEDSFELGCENEFVDFLKGDQEGWIFWIL
ncbi:MAG: hypothetical protein AAB336_14240 [Acidobacteriota bacterium]